MSAPKDEEFPTFHKPEVVADPPEDNRPVKVAPKEENPNREVGKPSGSTRVIGPEAKEVKEEAKRPDPFRHFDNEKLNRLAHISGRSMGTLAPIEGGALAWGNLNLINVDTNEQITVRPDGRIPDGLWVPANHLPEAYLDNLDD